MPQLKFNTDPGPQTTGVGVEQGVLVDVEVGAGVRVDVLVAVGVLVRVNVGETVGVKVTEGCGVKVGVQVDEIGIPFRKHALNRSTKLLSKSATYQIPFMAATPEA